MATIIQFPKQRLIAQDIPVAQHHSGTVLLFPRVVQSVPSYPEKFTRRKRGASQAEEQRKVMLGKIHIALAQLCERAKTTSALAGFSEDIYRFKLREDFGVDSAKSLKNSQLEEVLHWLISLGWTPKKRSYKNQSLRALLSETSSLSNEGLLEKIEAMLTEKGRVEGTNIPWGYAVSILKRQTSSEVTQLHKANREQLNAVIAALYRDAKRKGRRVR